MNFQIFRLVLEKAEEPEIKLPTSSGSLKEQESSRKNIYFCFIDYAKAFDCVDHNKLWKIVKEMWQDEALARDGVSREVPCSALKGETVPDSLPATPKSPPTRRVPPRGTPRVPAPLPLSPFSPPDRDRRGDSPAWSGRGSRPSRRTSG